MTLRADMPAEFANERVAVWGEVNGQPVRLIVDTASSGTLTLQPAVAARLALPEVGRVRHTGIGGVAEVSRVHVARVSLAGIELKEVQAEVQTLEDPAAGGRRDGDLEWGVLGRYDVELDPAARRVRLHEVSGCGDRLVPFAEPHFSLPMRFGPLGLPLMPLRVDGAEFLAFVATAGGVLFSRDTALRSGMSPSQLEAAPQVPLESPTGSLSCPAPRFRQVEIGEHVFRDVRTLVVPSLPGGVDGMVGGDYLLNQRVWISPATARIYIARRQAQPRG